MVPHVGHCRCGRVQLELTAPPLLTSACHCRGCQRMTSSAFSLTALIPAGGFRVVQGDPVIGGLHGAQQHHHHCGHCMTWMFTRIEGMDDMVNVRSVLFDDPELSRPYLETMASHKLDWVEIPAAHSYDGFPPYEDFGRLIAGYKGP